MRGLIWLCMNIYLSKINQLKFYVLAIATDLVGEDIRWGYNEDGCLQSIIYKASAKKLKILGWIRKMEAKVIWRFIHSYVYLIPRLWLNFEVHLNLSMKASVQAFSCDLGFPVAGIQKGTYCEERLHLRARVPWWKLHGPLWASLGSHAISYLTHSPWYRQVTESSYIQGQEDEGPPFKRGMVRSHCRRACGMGDIDVAICKIYHLL